VRANLQRWVVFIALLLVILGVFLVPLSIVRDEHAVSLFGENFTVYAPEGTDRVCSGSVSQSWTSTGSLTFHAEGVNDGLCNIGANNAVTWRRDLRTIDSAVIEHRMGSWRADGAGVNSASLTYNINGIPVREFSSSLNDGRVATGTLNNIFITNKGSYIEITSGKYTEQFSTDKPVYLSLDVGAGSNQGVRYDYTLSAVKVTLPVVNPIPVVSAPVPSNVTIPALELSWWERVKEWFGGWFS
jgi:hypothetical protein